MPANAFQLKIQPQIQKPAKPFVKWVGGKRRVIPELIRSMPESFEHYYEPFIGGGALFFHLRSLNVLQDNQITISDMNLRLIRTYRAIRDDVDSVIDRLEHHTKHHDKNYFYRVRDVEVDSYAKDVDVAAWFIYLNKTAFNGLYRVNKKNQFNAPFGRYKNPNICDTDNLLACHRALQNIDIVHGCFDQASKRAKKGDLVYFDPPYVPVSVTSSFTSYTSNGFGSLEQVILRDHAQRLKERGVFVMVSNAEHELVRSWYRSFLIRSIQVGRAINCKGSSRGRVGEVIIT